MVGDGSVRDAALVYVGNAARNDIRDSGDEHTVEQHHSHEGNNDRKNLHADTALLLVEVVQIQQMIDHALHFAQDTLARHRAENREVAEDGNGQKHRCR